MSYLTQAAIADNASMQRRVAQAAAEQDAPGDPDQWMYSNRRDWAAAPGWAAAWEYAINAHPDDGNPDTPPFDPGADEAVITDAMILSQVQGMLGPPVATPATP